MPDFSLTKIRSSPNWYIQWFEDGHSQRASTRTPDRGEAEAILAAFRLVRADQPLADLTVSATLDWYWDTHAKGLFRPATVELALKHLKPFFGTTLVSSLTRAKQQAYVEAKLAEGRSLASLRQDLITLSAAMKRAERFNKIDRAPAMLTLPTPAPRERWLTRDEVATLFRALRGDPVRRHVLIFARLALYTGARTGAILELTWDRVRFDRGLIDYRVPGRAETKKRRVISPMTPPLRRMLKHAKAKARSRHVVEFRGERIDRVAKAFIVNAERAGLEGVTPHVLRHTFASWAVQNRVPIYKVGKALGQTVASTTERYAKLAPEDVLEAMDAVRRK